MLYQWEVGGSDLGDVLATYPSVGTRTLDEEARRMAERLVRGTAVNLGRIDPLITRHAEHWRIERMPIVDRTILRLGIYELLEADAPRAVVIDEALELARAYGTGPSVKFINGVLDAVARSLARPAPDTDAPAS
jgi:N utilization substance protein B